MRTMTMSTEKHRQPVDPAAITQQAAEAFWSTCEELKRPLIVCSRSGALSTKIWETAEAAVSA